MKASLFIEMRLFFKLVLSAAVAAGSLQAVSAQDLAPQPMSQDGQRVKRRQYWRVSNEHPALS
jgi:hypothetical protein